MRVVLDTNVVVSGFLWDGPPSDILDGAEKGVVSLFSSDTLFDELFDIVKRKKFAERLSETRYTPDTIIEEYRKVTHIVEPVEFLEPPSIGDFTDVKVLATAFAAKARFIVSGDNHLLVLKRFSDINIISPSVFVKTVLKLLM